MKNLKILNSSIFEIEQKENIELLEVGTEEVSNTQMTEVLEDEPIT